MGTVAPHSDKIQVMIDPRDLGKSDSLRYNVLSQMRDEKYERAVSELASFMKKPSEYPHFHDRVSRYIEHASSLIRAIEMKRNFPGINRLTASKQQDLKLRVKQHMDELVFYLKKVERVESHFRIEDIRSTVIVVRSIAVSAFWILSIAFLVELSEGMLSNAFIVVDGVFHDASRYVYELLNPI